MSPNPRIQEYLFHILDPSNDNVPYLVSVYLSFLSVHMIKFNGLVYVTIVIINSTHITIINHLSLSGYADPHGANHRPRSIL